MEEEQKKQKPGEASAEALERVCAELPAAVEQMRKVLETQYYEPLAEEAMGPKWRDGVPGEEAQKLMLDVRREVDSLHRVSGVLFQAHQTVTGLEDELCARLRDVRSSRDRRWYAPNPPANGAIDLAEKRLNHFAQGLNAYKLLLVCFAGSFAGVVVEMLWAFARYGLIESRRGLVYGPFNLLYGAGAVFLTLFLYKYRNRGRLWSFAGGFVVGSALEYTCSWAQEALLGSRSWDYSAMPLNLNGRICLTYSVFWGILGILWIKDLYPRMASWILKIPNQTGRVLTWALTVFMVFNAAVSCVAVGRWSQRISGEPAKSGFWEMVDEHFPDERMERIYANMDFGKTIENIS